MGVFAAASLFISSAGLDIILRLSEPVLLAVYPVAIVLILLSFFDRLFERYRGVYVWSVVFTGVVSVIYGLQTAGLALPGNWLALWLPGYEAGLGWILPAAAGILLGMVFGHSMQNGKRDL